MTQLGKMLGQQGPPSGAGGLRDLWIIIPLLLVVLIIIIVCKYISPNLTKVKPTQDIGPQRTQETEKKAETQLPENKPALSLLVDEEILKDNKEALHKAQVDAAIQVLAEDEKKVVDALLAAGGTMLQKEISWKTGYSRVKTHRILVRLIRRGVVSAEKYYNTNRITLVDWLQKSV